MVINVAEAIDSDTAETISIERDDGAGSSVGGLFVKGSVTVLTSLASVQQPSPKDLQMLPEGERDQDIKLFISRIPLQTTRDRDGSIADLVTYKGLKYKMIRPADWDSYGFTRALGARVK